MVEFLYIDETGSVGRAARNQPYLTLVAAIVPEDKVQALAAALRRVAFKHLGWIPADFEFHGVELWGGDGHWAGKEPAELLAAYEDAIAVLPALEIRVAHSSIHKANLHLKYDGKADSNAYLLALQFLLERIELRGSDELKVVVADETKEHELAAIKLVSDLQRQNEGVVPGRKLERVIDSLHFVRSSDSPGVQIADLVAFALQRASYGRDKHPNAIAGLQRINQVIVENRTTRREAWPSQI